MASDMGGGVKCLEGMYKRSQARLEQNDRDNQVAAAGWLCASLQSSVGFSSRAAFYGDLEVLGQSTNAVGARPIEPAQSRIS